MSFTVMSLLSDVIRDECLVKFGEGKWKGRDMMFVTYGHKAYSHDGVNWSEDVSPSDLVYVGVGGKNGPRILHSKPRRFVGGSSRYGVSNLNNYCGLTTFLNYN